MNLEKTLAIASVAVLCAIPAWAGGGFAVHGTYWDTQDLAHGYGGGIRSSFDLGPVVDLDLGASYFYDLTRDTDQLHDFKMHALPLDAGLSFHVPTESGVSPYVGGGASYFILDTNQGEVADEVGWYGKAGLELGGDSPGPRFFAEAIYRDVTGTVESHRNDSDLPEVHDKIDLQLRGVGANVGVIWRW